LHRKADPNGFPTYFDRCFPGTGFHTSPPEATHGFAVAVFRIGDLVESSLRVVPEKGLSVSIFDTSESTPIFQAGSPALPNQDVISAQIDVAGRIWHLHFSATPEFQKPSAFAKSTIVFVGGLTITFLLAAWL